MSIDIHSKQFKIFLLILVLILILFIGSYAFFISCDQGKINSNLPKNDNGKTKNDGISKRSLNESVSAPNGPISQPSLEAIKSISAPSGKK